MSTELPARRHPMPFTRIEVAVMTVAEGALAVLLGRRAEAPFAGRWALPGGALRIDLDKTLEDAARRVINERLGIELPYLRQICAVGGATRDPRAPWSLSVIYRALVPLDSVAPTAGKRLEVLRWCAVDEAAEDAKLAFDHRRLVARAAAAVRNEIEELDLPFEFLPSEFTLGELQGLCEVMLGRRLDKSSFRRRLSERDLVEPIPGEMRIAANRPAQLYRRKGT